MNQMIREEVCESANLDYAGNQANLEIEFFKIALLFITCFAGSMAL